jgi:hypothetical protein
MSSEPSGMKSRPSGRPARIRKQTLRDVGDQYSETSAEFHLFPRHNENLKSSQLSASLMQRPPVFSRTVRPDRYQENRDMPQH